MGLNYLKKVTKSSPVFRSILFPLTLAFGAFTPLLSKSFITAERHSAK